MKTGPHVLSGGGSYSLILTLGSKAWAAQRALSPSNQGQGMDLNDSDEMGLPSIP